MLRALALSAALSLAAADTNVPPQFVGTYNGNRQQQFALTDASNSNSYECMNNNQTSTRSAKITIQSNNKVTINSIPAQTIQQGASTYTIPAVAQQDFVWADYNTATSIAQLRVASNLQQIQCFYITEKNGTAGNQLTWVVFGGQVVTTAGWQIQCDPATYQSLGSTFATQPACITSGASRSPVNSSILYTASSGNPDNGAGSTFASAVAAAAAVAGAAMLL